MMTLDEAWAWYCTTKDQLKWFGRLGWKHWNDLPWDGPLGRDDRLNGLESGEIVTGSHFCLEHLDDFAVLILFSVFESKVRDQVLFDIESEKDRLTHDLIVQLVDNAIPDIEQGSFYRVLEVFKKRNKDLVEEVNQVRKYRNWVAHGRRNDRIEEAVDPATAFDRLRKFLDILTRLPSEESGTVE